MRLKLNLKGIVQGVGFRPFIYRTARAHKLKGYVRNRGDAGVEILIEGKKRDIQSFLEDLDEKRPPLAQIHEVAKTVLKGRDNYQDFVIQRSSEDIQDSGSIVPPDVSICNQCLKELRQLEDRRYNYFFITCTDCGPRYTIIDRLPYDRENTTMRSFKMCSFCNNQYVDPLDRRFHAQTVACPMCGPKVILATNMGEQIDAQNPIFEAGKLLSKGKVLAIKGYGGFHVAASTLREKPLLRLRETKHRKQKPFALMARSLEATKTFAEVSKDEEKMLTSFARPIVLLDKRKDYYLSELVAPQLHNIGVMLPYTGLHYMLFDKVNDAAFVMTSANPPNQPIIKDNQEALGDLGSVVDYFLFNDRPIAYRCDDSVIRMHGKDRVFIRRSRGYAPAPIILRKKIRRNVAAVGGELNNTACILLDIKAFISQHVGDVENIETEAFLRQTINHLINLTNAKIDAVACDLHPGFVTTNLAREFAEEFGYPVVQVQHHYAHLAGLMAEHNVSEMIGICCDGYGYGSNGEAWGGEILLSQQDKFGFNRLAHLQEQSLIGGDSATRYPLRMAASILFGQENIEDWLIENREHLPYGEEEIRILMKQVSSESNAVRTTSCGRILDAVSAILGICYERTYEGEPSIKLESAAKGGKDVLKLKPVYEDNTLTTTNLVQEVFEKREVYSKKDLAYSTLAYLARGLAIRATELSLENDVKAVGFSGGAAANKILMCIMRNIVKSKGLEFLIHEALPCGDGGLSFGQAVAVGFSSSLP